MIGVIITKPTELPYLEIDAMIQSCKLKLIDQLQLTRVPDLDSFGSTAIDTKGGASSVEQYAWDCLKTHCPDFYLTTDANGHPLALIGGILQDDGTFDVRMSLHNDDENGSSAYVYDIDFQSEDLIEQYNALGCERYRCFMNFGVEVPDYLEQQGFINISEPEDNFITLQGPWGWYSPPKDDEEPPMPEPDPEPPTDDEEPPTSEPPPPPPK